MQIRKKCALCGNEFVADRKTAKFCSIKCQRQSQNQKNRERASEQRAAKQKAKGSQPETMESCKHPDCYYHSGAAGLLTCDYILYTGTPRGCKPSECDKYRPRSERTQKSIVIFDRLTEEEKAIRRGQYGYETQKRHSKERN